MNAVKNLSVISFTGADARDFLHRQLSADIRAIDDGSAGFACCCNPKGRVVALMLLFRDGDNLFAACHESLAEVVLAHLQRFVFRDQVQIKKEPGMGIEIAISEGDHQGWFEATPGLNYRLVQRDTRTVLTLAMAHAQLRAGVCWLNSSSSEQFLPQMLGFEALGALSFSKGCYPGQEIIARTRYLGKLKRQAMTCEITEELADINPMDKVSLHVAEDHIKAVVVDVSSTSQGTMLRLVVRSDALPNEAILEFEGKSYPLRRVV